MADSVSDRFLRLLAKVSAKANQEHIKAAKFLLREKITRKQMEQCTDMRDLFDKLMTKGQLASDNVEMLKYLNEQVFVDRDIENMIRKYENGEPDEVQRPTAQEHHSQRVVHSSAVRSSHSTPERTASKQSTIPTKFTKLFNYTADHIGDDWKKLARLMGLLDHQIEKISHQEDGQYLQANRAMTVWFSKQDKPSTKEFKRLLRRIPRNDIADELQDALSLQ